MAEFHSLACAGFAEVEAELSNGKLVSRALHFQLTRSEERVQQLGDSLAIAVDMMSNMQSQLATTLDANAYVMTQLETQQLDSHEMMGRLQALENRNAELEARVQNLIPPSGEDNVSTISHADLFQSDTRCDTQSGHLLVTDQVCTT